MAWLIKTVSSSVGKKLLMALTGLAFCCFLLVHLMGNLFLYCGKDAFNSYVEHLHSLGVLINVAEVFLLVFAIIHVVSGLTLTWQNYTSRPEKYVVNKRAGGRTIGSATMPYTGIILLGFIVAHLRGFHFADHETQTVYDIVVKAFSDPAIMGFYTFAMIVAAVHVSHGVWSAFQTLGLSHEKYTPAIRKAGLLFSITIGAGFGFIPLWIAYFL